MILEICAILAVLIFLVLSYFIIRTLIAVNKTLKRVNNITEELNVKLAQIDPLFCSFENMGEIFEEKSAVYRDNYLEKRGCSCSCACKNNDSSDDLENLLIASYKLCAHYLRRK